MTTKTKVKKFRVQRGAKEQATVGAAQAAGDPSASAPPPTGAPTAAVTGPQSIDDIQQEGLSGRQLRLARRIAQKHGLTVTSDFDAVRQLRSAGIDPFEQSNLMDLKKAKTKPVAAPSPNGQPDNVGRVQLPQIRSANAGQLQTEVKAENPVKTRRDTEIKQIQKSIANRRKRRSFLLVVRLLIFVALPTLMAGWYFAVMATPMYATKTEFVIQQADSGAGAAAGLGGMFQGTSMATQQDSIAVQAYLQSRSAMLRLDEDFGYKAHFSDPSIDQIQRLPDDATNEDAFSLYSDKVKISYDPTEGLLKMEVIATTPEASQIFAEALINYAEERVDQLTQRLREDQMAGARQGYEDAERRRAEALDTWLRIQEETDIIDPIGETGAFTAQISALESQRQQLQLDLSERLSVRRPNEAQVNSLRGQISDIEGLIAGLRSQMTETGGSASLASRNTELRLAEENYTFQTIMVQESLAQMEASQIEANRQVRYLSLGVEPVATDEAAYPRVFENTVLSFLIFAGVYLMLSITASVLREQITS